MGYWSSFAATPDYWWACAICVLAGLRISDVCRLVSVSLLTICTRAAILGGMIDFGLTVEAEMTDTMGVTRFGEYLGANAAHVRMGARRVHSGCAGWADTHLPHE